MLKLLNTLYEENEQLKHTLSAYMVDLNRYKDKSNKLKTKNKVLEQDIQDYEDAVIGWFIEHWYELSEEQQQTAHLEVGVDEVYFDD